MNINHLMLGNLISKEGHGTIVVTPSTLLDIIANPDIYEGLTLREYDLINDLGFKPINRTSTVMWGHDMHLHFRNEVWTYEDGETPLKFEFVHQLQNYLTLIKTLV